MADVKSQVDETSSRVSNGIADSKDDDSFGVANGRIDDSALYSSSALNSACGASQARLNNQPVKEKYGAWSPMYNDKNQYLDVDLGDIVLVGSIATQGRPGYDQDGGWFLQSYSLSSSNDGENFTNLREYGISKVFEGNTDPETVVKNALKTALKCRYLRIRPVTWHNHIALRVEVYKCTGPSGSSRKRSAQQKQNIKATSDRVKSRPGNTRGKELTTQVEVENKTNVIASKQIKKSEEIEKESKNIGIVTEDLNNGNSFEEIGNAQNVQPEKDELNDFVDPKESFEIIGTTNEDKLSITQQITETPMEKVEAKPIDDVGKVADQPAIERRPNVRNQAGNFESRQSVDHLYSLKMKQASAVSKHSDGTKYIGKIKLIKKEQPPPEEEDVQPKETKKLIDCEVSEPVKRRVTDYKDIVIRKRDSKVDDDIQKRRSVILEDDLSYLNQMEVSMHERLKMFKETESKGKEETELSKQEEEKRRLLKQDAEKRRSIALQKEQERIQSLILKQKEEEEEKRRQLEISEKEASEEFEEIDAAVMTVPAIVSDRLRLFTESKSGQKKQELLMSEEAKRGSLKRDNDIEQSGEFVEINVDDAITVPAIVSDRLKLFKQTEKQQKEKHKLEEMEAEKWRLSKINAEKKRLLAVEREKEKLEELKKKKNEEDEKRKAEEARKEELLKENVVDKPEIPAIVRDRLKIFKEGEKAQKEKNEVLKLDADRRRIAKEEAERRRSLAEERERIGRNENINAVYDTRDEELQSEAKVGNESEEEIIAVEESLNVESEMYFDFMDNEEEDVNTEDNIKTDVETISEDEKQRIRKAKQKFMQFDQPRIESQPVKRVGKLKNKDIFKQSALQHQDETQLESNGDIATEESLDLQKRLQEIDAHHEGYDPEQERRMLEEAEAAFRSFKASSKSESRPKRSAKTENLIKSFSVAISNPSEQVPKGGKVKMESTEKQTKASNQPRLKAEQSFEEEVIQAETNQEIFSAPDILDLQSHDAEKPDEQVKPDSLVFNTGLVKQRANEFSNPSLPQGDTSKTTHSNVKKWIASNAPVSSPQDATGRHDSNISLLQTQIGKTERQIADLSMRIEQLKLEDREEEALDLEEEYHASKLELSKIKRKLLKIQKDGSKSNRRNSSSSSECYSVPDDTFSDRASSTSSRTPRGGTLKASREIKSFTEKQQPSVDVSAFNDDGEVVTEGTVVSQIQSYESESAKQRKERAEMRKSLSLSHSSLDFLENPPPMGFGGPEFAKDKSKLSKECKMPRGTPVPPVESTAFNDEGECVPEGNVVEQVKVFSKS